MNSDNNIAGHYSSGTLWDRLLAALREDGVDTSKPSIEQLAPYDQFHGRGLEATEEIAARLSVASSDHILDVGSGIGGPARYFARRFGCHVTGIDLTAEFCEVARRLNELLGLSDVVGVEQGDALSMPFDDGSFDGAYSMNVAMNIENKTGLYQELHRVIKPGGWLVLSEIAQGPTDGLEYPTPWARTAESSFLSTPERTRAALDGSGFKVHSLQETVDQTLAFGARSRALVDEGRKPPHRAVMLVHGASAATAMANTARGVREGFITPIEVHCVRDS